MTASSLPYRLFVGIDIAAKTCAVSWMSAPSRPSRAITIEQTPRGFAELPPGTDTYQYTTRITMPWAARGYLSPASRARMIAWARSATWSLLKIWVM
jgi:hypothetical protein